MNKHALHTQRGEQVQSIENEWLRILQGHAQQIRVIYHKKRYYDTYPPELAWAQLLGRWQIVQVTSKAITVMVYRETTKGKVEGNLYTLDREWLHKSVWDVSHIARVKLLEFQQDANAQELERLRVEQAKALKIVREKEEELRNAKVKFRRLEAAVKTS